MNRLRKIIREQIQLNEAYLNLFTPEEKRQYVDEVWDIMQKSYAPIGGFLSAESKEHLIADSWFWKVVKRGNKIVAAQIYKDKLGRKSIAVGSDGSSEGKMEVKKMIHDNINLKDRNAWAEVSGAMEHLMTKYGAVPIPNFMAKSILKDKEILSYNPDGYHYTRVIGDEPHEKIIMGNVKI